MNLDQVVVALKRAREISGHTEYVVIGSLSILGVEEVHAIPEEMSMSIDIDCYTKADPPRIFDLAASLGEDSAFRIEHGYYLDPCHPICPACRMAGKLACCGWTGTVCTSGSSTPTTQPYPNMHAAIPGICAGFARVCCPD